ncbi:hydantoinase/oxoprolinase family protein [Aerobium aerolatum]|uniref:N-methylhydantoinase A n=1 Tax=Aquamicrobium aerolatum DSM 21857 TaxID=1121003 RepID=A0A1I3I2I7_9HYPH|nr:hydantoinase/oxoprolinase family protein [Aquamicrobium aerolatum]SFI42057.1 N-methylhydantoinase A [Aquamicrobium aerolatum DSM 21857]
MAVTIGVDVGGTFTDFLLVDTETGEIRTGKVPTTVDDRARGFLDGIAGLGIKPDEIRWLVHGTTAGTNAVLEHKGAKTGLITTEGFRDVLELGRRTRPYAYGLSGTFTPLIPRDLRREVGERMDAKGRVITPVDIEAVVAQAKALLAEGVESLVIQFLHSYVNPEHEIAAARAVREIWPNPYVVASHEIVREMREFERGSTAAIHASIAPIVSSYIDKVDSALKAQGFDHDLLIMQANGGMAAAPVIAEHAVHTIMSGPAAGVLAAAELASLAGYDNVVTGDMGGTSFDIALVTNGVPLITSEKELAYAMPIRIPMIDISTIGAGGGSIAHIDKAGMLRVGPESAGSYPGPIGYGRGGDRVTITDCNYMLGRLNPHAVTGASGDAPLAEIETALTTQIGTPLGLDAVAAAQAVIDVAVADMAGAIRLISVEKGIDPRDFTYIPYGGGGPLHAVAIARMLNLPRVLVPRYPGLNSALGCVLADVRHDFVQTINLPLAQIPAGQVDEIVASQIQAGKDLLAREKVVVNEVVLQHEFELLYRGQSHVLRIPAPEGAFDAEKVRLAFREAFLARFAIELPTMIPVLVNVRTTIIGRRDRISLADFTPKGGNEDAAFKGTRRAWFDGAWCETKIFDREQLPIGFVFHGPAIVEQSDTTLILDPGTRGEVDALGNIIITFEERAA